MTTSITLAHRRKDFFLDIDITLPRDGVTALFGPSGAGKTTVINAVAGLFRPTDGVIVVNDRTVLDTPRGLFVAPSKRGFGYVFQDARLFPHLSVKSNLLFGWKRARQRLPDDEVQRLIRLLGLQALLARRPRELSGGERQRVALGRALLASPQLLLLDEPLSGVDTSRKHEILPYLERLRDDVRLPMLYVSHALDEVSRLADEVVVMDAGRVVAQGSVGEILARSDLGSITGSADAGAVLVTTVAARYPDVELTELAFEDYRLLVPEIGQPVGSTARVHIRALDVTLALEEPKNISANNVWPARITQVRADSGAYADIQLVCGSASVLARITRASAQRLQLSEGVTVFAIIKSVTVDRGTGSRD
ncbi:MAG: molybdate transport system ATP-binding protein [Gammaproteobacteria bacterium]